MINRAPVAPAFLEVATVARRMTTTEQTRVPIRKVEVKNFLSLQDISVNLGKLNVLVGPNGGGKSNFLSVFRFLGEVARTDLAPALGALFGGYDRTICRAITTNPKPGIRISVEGEITSYSSSNAPDEYSLNFRQLPLPDGRKFLRRDEELLLKRSAGRGRRITLKGARYEYETIRTTRTSLLNPSRSRTNVRATAQRAEGVIEQDASALSVLRRIGRRSDTDQVNELAEVFEDLRLFDPAVQAARRPSALADGKRLSPTASNLAAVLMSLKENQPDVLSAIEDDIRSVLPGFNGFHFIVSGEGVEAVRIEIKEIGIRDAMPMAFVSFGTVRAIALFTMLRDPEPPRLTCLEEVDHGLHPHALDILVDRLRDASERSQIIVATHSPALVNRLRSDELIVFERDSETGVTRVPLIDPKIIDKMKVEAEFGLGELWYSGLLGGTPT